MSVQKVQLFCHVCREWLETDSIKLYPEKTFCSCGVWWTMYGLDFVDPDNNEALTINVAVTRKGGELQFMASVA